MESKKDKFLDSSSWYEVIIEEIEFRTNQKNGFQNGPFNLKGYLNSVGSIEYYCKSAVYIMDKMLF